MKAKLVVAVVVFAALVFPVPSGSSTVGLQQVRLACSDGNDTALALDPGGVAQLSDAAAQMVLFPAGLSCSVSQSTTTSPSSSGGGNKDFAVGGGKIAGFVSPCATNFALSAHTLDGLPTSAKGTFNASIPGGCLFGGGELRTHVVCLAVSANHADIAGVVDKATGDFAGFASQGFAIISATDGDGAGFDMLGFQPSAARSCAPTAETAIDNGKINVHDAT